MKNVFAMLLSLFFVQTIYAQDAQNTERLTDETVPFVYESRAKLPASDEKLAEFLSADYRNARVEFTKQELLEKIKPVIKSTLAEAKSKGEYILRVGTKLGQYDFNKKQFPSGFSSSTFIPFEIRHDFGMALSRYAVIFDNIKDVENIPLPLDAAKSLSGKLQQSRAITAVVYCRIISTQEKQLNYSAAYKVINAHITKVDFSSDDDALISSINIP